MFVTFEGPEGSGKSANIGWLAETFRVRGHRVLVAREPGGTDLGERLRGLLLSGIERGGRFTDALLFNAARSELVATVIRPALEQGVVVLCDRFTDSTLAYQGYGDGLPLSEVQHINRLATGGLVPDRTILLDLDVEQGLQRKMGGAEWNAIDERSLNFHRAVLRGFRQMAQDEPARWRVVDASQPLSDVQGAISRCFF